MFLAPGFDGVRLRLLRMPFPCLAGDLPTGSAKISLRGRGNAYLAPLDFLDAGMLGAGNVFLHGKPRQSAIRTNGTGVVRDVIPDSEPLYDPNATKPKLQIDRQAK